MNTDTPPTPPYIRTSSPSPSTSPTPALLACPALDRSFSTASTVSTLSGHSTTSQSSSSSAASRRRGYVRPQGAAFAESAKNRDSVMSLGSIAHLQYYFARTGLLDGKGGQIAKPRKDGEHGQYHTVRKELAYSSGMSSPNILCPNDTTNLAAELIGSPIEGVMEGQDWEEQEPVMLPPTVSTYSHRVQHVPSPPDAQALRKDLRQALEEARRALKETQDHEVESGDGWTGHGNELVQTDNKGCGTAYELPPTQGWYELQGIHLLDIVTLALRSAKIYYTAHDHPERLKAIKSERKIREELLEVLDVLKRMATRNFAGGLKEEERIAIDNWVFQVEELLDQEQEKERLDLQERERWQWLNGDWTGREREREWMFVDSFSTGSDRLPPWDQYSQAETLPTQFLLALQSGLRLVRLHNDLVSKSKRHFGEIKTFHIDTAKPYRCAENLRYWIKAAEIRWEVKLKVDVTGVVHGQNDEAWRGFDIAILTWCKVVREELTIEWADIISNESPPQDITWVPPQLKFEMNGRDVRS
ncbi:MAG: hypothetical protein M1830_010224 [Pleopsidium flavum]|nr:MAG: hypothetical protein M1830_010224 [Pleopsidium flavum]